MSSTPQLIAADALGRIALGRDKSGECYEVVQDPMGKITLTPVEFVPSQEQWLIDDGTARASLLRGIGDAALGRVTDGGEFSPDLRDEGEN